MTNNEILKVIEMIDDNNNKKAKDYLKTQLVKNTDKKGYNILSLVKKIIITKETESRPVLRTIQHTNNGEQVIVDGFVGIKWKQHENAIDIMEQTPCEMSLQIDQIFRTMANYTLTENDEIILCNIDKVVDLIMADKQNKKDKYCQVSLFGKFFDLNVIKNVIKICLAYDNDFENTTFTTDEEATKPVQLENENIKAIILPCRILDKEEQEKIDARTQQVVDIIKGVE